MRLGNCATYLLIFLGFRFNVIRYTESSTTSQTIGLVTFTRSFITGEEEMERREKGIEEEVLCRFWKNWMANKTGTAPGWGVEGGTDECVSSHNSIGSR
jgi:hypothetical protein